jgi:hypothetical protein
MRPDLQFFRTLSPIAQHGGGQDVEHVVAENRAQIRQFAGRSVERVERTRVQRITDTELHVTTSFCQVVVELSALVPLLDRARRPIRDEKEQPIVEVSLLLKADGLKRVQEVFRKQSRSCAQFENHEGAAVVDLDAVGEEQHGRVLREPAGVIDDERDVAVEEGQQAGAVPVQLRELPLEALRDRAEFLEREGLSGNTAQGLYRIGCRRQLHSVERGPERKRDARG